MTGAADHPAYARVAADLRARIFSGDLAPGARLPGRHELAVEHGVAEGVIRVATQMLLREGLLVSRPGSGTFVRERTQRRPLIRSWFQDRLAQQLEEQGREGAKFFASDTTQAPSGIRERLGMGDPDAHRHDVMRTAYRFAAGFDDTPWMLLTSWEPLSLTRGTVISFPESGPHAGQSIPHRMAAIGITVDTWREDVCARPASPDEAKRFDIAKGSILIVIERAYYAGDQVVEVADIIVPAEATKLVYNGPVGDR